MHYCNYFIKHNLSAFASTLCACLTEPYKHKTVVSKLVFSRHSRRNYLLSLFTCLYGANDFKTKPCKLSCFLFVMSSGVVYAFDIMC